MSNEQQLPNMKYVPHKKLEEKNSYLSIPDDDVIIAIRLEANKISKVIDKDGKPIIDPVTKLPQYFLQHTPVITVLSKAEYLVKKQMEER